METCIARASNETGVGKMAKNGDFRYTSKRKKMGSYNGRLIGSRIWAFD